MRIEGPLQNPLQGRVSEALSGLREQLASRDARGADDEAAHAFETYFSTMVVKELRRALPDGIFAGAGSDVYTAWFDEHLGKTLAERDALGIGAMIRAAIDRQASAEADAAGVEEDLR